MLSIRLYQINLADGWDGLFEARARLRNLAQQTPLLLFQQLGLSYCSLKGHLFIIRLPCVAEEIGAFYFYECFMEPARQTTDGFQCPANAPPLAFLKTLQVHETKEDGAQLCAALRRRLTGRPCG